MYKNLSIVLLLAAFGLAGRSFPSTPSSGSVSIVATVSPPNQTAPFPSRVRFTPTTTGLFRVTAYMTEVVPLANNGGCVWTYRLG
jgi:hypothetical protein